MFTGLIQDLGRVERLVHKGPEAELVVASQLGDFVHGESIAINGVCLSVTAFQAHQFTVFASRETLASSGIGQLRGGQRVNLERALRAGDALGGHIVSGHVDARVPLRDRQRVGAAEVLTFGLPEGALAAQVAPKGSVALDGVSLTVNDVGPDAFAVMVIPITLQQTTLGALVPGDWVNLETDVLAKYVSRMLSLHTSAADDAAPREITLDMLINSGFVR